MGGGNTMEFYKRLKRLREDKGLSQEELAEKLNIPRTSVTHYERGDDRIPRPKRLQEIADFFGVSVDYLLGISKSTNSRLKENEENFIKDIDQLTLEEVMKKYAPDLIDKPATEEEVKAAIAFIRSLRSME